MKKHLLLLFAALLMAVGVRAQSSTGFAEFDAPTVSLDSVFDIGEHTAKAFGNVIDDGGDTINKRGVCWNTTGNPEYPGDTHQSSSGTLGGFEVNLSGLASNTTYFVRAYARNSVGISYSEELEFTTVPEMDLPTVITGDVTNIGQTSAFVEGEVSHDGNSEVTERGICWSTSTNPTINDAHLSNGIGIGTYTVEITGLQSGTTYYARAYAVNSIGIAYGEVREFVTGIVSYNIVVDYNEGGTVAVEPNMAPEHTIINIIIEIDGDFELQSISAYNVEDVTEIVSISESNTFEMPAFNVMVKAVFSHKQGAVSDIEAPNPICAGEILELTEPDYEYHLFAEHTVWQLSAQSDFGEYIEYENQPLEVSYNGWWLRFVVSYIWGNSYSNSVQITVNNMDGFTLTGDADICTSQESAYSISDIENDSISWYVSDPAAIVTVGGDHIKVLWTTAGQQQVSASVTDLLTGCFIQLEMDVTVNSFIDANTLNEIVQKDEYVLIYPNPADVYKYQWYKDGERIDGANKQYYYQTGGLDNGTYKVYVSFNEEGGNLICGAFSPEIVVNGSVKASLSFYPNPSHIGETIVLINNDNEEAILNIYAIDGRLLHTQTVMGNHISLDLNLPQGVYVASLTNKEGSKTEKIVIQ